jgi:hypothetical protein
MGSVSLTGESMVAWKVAQPAWRANQTVPEEGGLEGWKPQLIQLWRACSMHAESRKTRHCDKHVIGQRNQSAPPARFEHSLCVILLASISGP